LLVNEEFVRRYLPGVDPIGLQVSVDRDDDKWWEIAGVVANVPANARESQPAAEVFTHIQATGWPQLAFTIRLSESQDAKAVSAAAKKALARLDSTILPDARSMSEVIEETWQKPSRTLAWMSGFALIALLLALIGIYGMLAADVSARTQEIGVRVALGARQSDILVATFRRGAWITAIGMTAGGVLALAGMEKVRDLAFGRGAS
jgi:hypothetical protein